MESIDTDILSMLSGSDYIPVIAPVAGSTDGQTYNINADLVAGKLAEVLRARSSCCSPMCPDCWMPRDRY